MIPEVEADARGRLLNAAEKLFGERGLQSSIRHITAEAGANLAAVNYHFRTKQKLVAEVLARRAAPINAERIRLLEQVETEAEGRPAPVEKILDAFLRPTIELMEKHPDFLRFAGRLSSDPDPVMREVLHECFGETFRRFHAALCGALPQLPRREVGARLGYFVGSVLFAWTNLTEMMPMFGDTQPVGSAEERMGLLVQYAAGGMRAAPGKWSET